MIENTNTKQFYPGPILNNTLEITDFLFNDAEQIKIKHSKLNEEDVLIDVDLNYPTDYEVTKVLPSDINAAEAALTASTGQVMLKNVNVLAGEKLTVYRVSQIIQDKDYPRTGAFPAATHEGALDYLTMQNQEQKDEIDRALKVPVSTEGFSGNLPVPIPSRALKINNDGTGFEMSEFDPDTALALTEDFKNQAQQAAIDALSSQTAAANSETVAIQQSQNATNQAANAKISADNAAELNQQLTNNFNNYNNSLISTKEDGMTSLANASNALRQTQITNCLLEVPQRIKYTLVDGILTIKANSVFIVPYGVTNKTSQFPVGSRFLHDNFKVYDTQFADGKFFVWAELQSDIGVTASTSTGNGVYTLAIKPQLNSIGVRIARTQQGSGDGSNLKPNDMYYHTVNNAITQYLNGINEDVNCSFPVFLINKDDTGYTSIDQVFNGFGYIGSTIWRDKGIKYLVSNGRNEDRSLKNIEVTANKVSTITITGSHTGTYSYVLGSNHNIYYGSGWYHDEANNYVRNANGVITLALFQNPKLVLNAGKIESFEIKQPFRAIDYSDKSTVSSWSMPSNRYIDLTLGASGSSYTAPANGWIFLRKTTSGANQYVELINNNNSMSIITTRPESGSTCSVYIPCKKGEKVLVYYSTGGETKYFRFIYAEGEV